MFSISALAKPYFALFAGVGLLCCACSYAEDADGQLAHIRLPKGFAISVYAEGLAGSRQMALSAQGTLFVGTRGGNVYALRDSNGDGQADQQYVIAKGLEGPNGVAVRDGDLYVAEVPRLRRYANIEAHLSDPPQGQVLTDDLPTSRHHGYRYIRFGPDGRLYLPIGAPCNVCEAPGYGVVLSMTAQGKDKRVFAQGIRNTVGFDWQPGTGVLWFTDNGRDNLGDNRPPGELNRVAEVGQNFGFPYCHGGDIPDPKFGDKHQCSEFAPPAQKLGPHVAPLGMRFYNGTMFPKTYRGDILIAEHGSWNRSKKIGYRVTRVIVDGDKAIKYEPFATGWLQGQSAWGRPVDVLVAADGALLVSDDQAGRIYRITYHK